MIDTKTRKIRRHKRIRAKIFGTKERPRLSVFRSNRHIYAQLIDDEKSKILGAVSDKDLKGKAKVPEKSEIKLQGQSLMAYNVGKLVAEKANGLKIEQIVFDRGGFKYHGTIKALADGAREGGLKF